jgi:hypothetical protein
VENGVKAVDKELLRYQHAISSGSTGGDSIKTRINILTKRLATSSPRFSAPLGAYHEATDEVSKNISELTAGARNSIYDVNRKHAAAHGVDLFKVTTESSAALSTIGEPGRAMEQYGNFVDALYFLVYEGSGACKRLPDPPPDFSMDVKFLRTAIRYDVSHGSTSEVRSKKIRAGETFEKFSGKKTPEECGPEEFLSTQVRILRELVSFLSDP